MVMHEEADHAELAKYSFIDYLFTFCSATWCNQFVRKLPVDGIYLESFDHVSVMNSYTRAVF